MSRLSRRTLQGRPKKSIQVPCWKGFRVSASERYFAQKMPGTVEGSIIIQDPPDGLLVGFPKTPNVFRVHKICSRFRVPRVACGKVATSKTMILSCLRSASMQLLTYMARLHGYNRCRDNLLQASMLTEDMSWQR